MAVIQGRSYRAGCPTERAGSAVPPRGVRTLVGLADILRKYLLARCWRRGSAVAGTLWRTGGHRTLPSTKPAGGCGTWFGVVRWLTYARLRSDRLAYARLAVAGREISGNPALYGHPILSKKGKAPGLEKECSTRGRVELHARARALPGTLSRGSSIRFQE